jgi:hypothetical protein
MSLKNISRRLVYMNIDYFSKRLKTYDNWLTETYPQLSSDEAKIYILIYRTLSTENARKIPSQINEYSCDYNKYIKEHRKTFAEWLVETHPQLSHDEIKIYTQIYTYHLHKDLDYFTISYLKSIENYKKYVASLIENSF